MPSIFRRDKVDFYSEGCGHNFRPPTHARTATFLLHWWRRKMGCVLTKADPVITEAEQRPVQTLEHRHDDCCSPRPSPDYLSGEIPFSPAPAILDLNVDAPLGRYALGAHPTRTRPASGAGWDCPEHGQLENYRPDLGEGDFTVPKFKMLILKVKNKCLLLLSCSQTSDLSRRINGNYLPMHASASLLFFFFYIWTIGANDHGISTVFCTLRRFS